ncbi:DUF6297 family protein [Mumia quercus]|uniref:DUF6297 family protein n=1 Tax=Mumia quercus TaxID=2976125 RepID=UPI0021D1F5DD|nr:DUF6297 family protein [Mumia quercus]
MAVFATVMLGGMFVNAVVQAGAVTDRLCASAACSDARSLVPWLVAGASLLAVVGASRLFGPVYVTPADATWLVSSPLDRAALLRPRLARVLLTTLLVTCAATGVGVLLAGASRGEGLAFTATAALLASVVAATCAYAQEHDRRSLVAGAQWVLVVVLWAAVAAVAVGEAPSVPLLPVGGPVTVVVVVAAAAAAVLGSIAAWRHLGRLRRRDVAGGGELAPGLSGALATLDLALAYDVVLAHRWRDRGAVRSGRGGPGGALALLTSELRRLRRSPHRLVVLAGTVVVPYAAAAAGTGRFVVLVAAAAGFAACLPLLSGLRVVSRGPSVARALPFSSALAQVMTAALPTLAALAYGAATTAAMREGDADPGAALACGLAVGAAAAASGVRWTTRRPPDYTRPLIATPAGAVPTNLYGSIIAGFDVLLLTVTPMLLAPDVRGATVSLLLSVGVWAYLVSRPPAR